MNLFSRLPNSVIFIASQLLVSALYCVFLVSWNHRGDVTIQDELLIFLLPPVFYASFRYSTRVYLASLFVTVGLALCSIAYMNLHFWNSFTTITVVSLSTLFSAEGIYRMHLSRLHTEKILNINQARLQAIISEAADAIHTKDRNGIIVSANKAFSGILGLKVDEVIGKTVFDLFRPAFALSVHQSDQRSVRGEIIRIEETAVFDGRERTFSCTKVPLYNDEGEIFEICTIAHDITDLKQNQIEREKLIGELQAALKDVRHLNELLPICSSCKKIRDDRGYWNQVDEYIRAHTGTEFSHGLCPECSKEYFGEYCDELEETK